MIPNCEKLKKSTTNTFINLLICAALVGLMAGMTSCRSHKHKEKAYVGETIEKKGKKKNDNNGNNNSTPYGHEIAQEAQRWVGTPYGYGCNEKGVATDCSGLVLTVYLDIADVKLPRNSAEQADFCDNIEEGEIEEGDLVFFATGKDKSRISHVGVMIDGIRFVHSSSSKGVIISEMSTPYYQRTFRKYGRVPINQHN